MGTPTPIQFDCEECGKTHRAGDKLEVLSDGRVIRIACVTHAVQANQLWIKRFEAAFPKNLKPDDANAKHDVVLEIIFDIIDGMNRGSRDWVVHKIFERYWGR